MKLENKLLELIKQNKIMSVCVNPSTHFVC